MRMVTQFREQDEATKPKLVGRDSVANPNGSTYAAPPTEAGLTAPIAAEVRAGWRRIDRAVRRGVTPTARAIFVSLARPRISFFVCDRIQVTIDRQ